MHLHAQNAVNTLLNILCAHIPINRKKFTFPPESSLKLFCLDAFRGDGFVLVKDVGGYGHPHHLLHHMHHTTS